MAEPTTGPARPAPNTSADAPAAGAPKAAPVVASPGVLVELHWIAPRHPALDFAFERLQVWAQRRGGVRVVPAPVSYETLVDIDKLLAELRLPNPSVDITWHNDDWGQLWGQYLEPLDDIKIIREKTNRSMYDPFWIWEGKVTGVPFVETLQTFFIRKDLIPEVEVVDWTWQDMVKRLNRLQADGKVRWGYVGGMKYPHTWFTWLWSLWANNADLYLPRYERDNSVLQQNGWSSGATEHSWVETLEFWWDAVHTFKISPPDLPGFSRADADAIFIGGEAAITSNDTPLWAAYTDRQKSKVAEKVGFAGFPVGPSGDKRTAHRAPLGFAIPKNVSPEKKAAAKEGLSFLLSDDETQVQLWKKTGSVPANVDVQGKLRAEDELFDRLMTVAVDAPKTVLPAYYFPQWPQVNALLSDSLGRFMVGEKSSAPQVLKQLAEALHKIPQGS